MRSPTPSMRRIHPPSTLVTRAQVSNKCIELMMMFSGQEVCCTSEADRTLLQRVDSGASAGGSGGGD